MKKALLSFIILFISFNCFGTEKEIAYAVRSTELLHGGLEDIVAGYAETFSDEWLDILNKLNELAPRTSNLRNKAIQALVDILTGYIGERDRFIRGIIVSERSAAGLPALIGTYSAESIESYARELLAKPATSEMEKKLMNMANDFESIVFYFKFEAHQEKFDAEVYNKVIDKLETIRKLASTKDGFKSLVRLYYLIYERFGGNNWRDDWNLNPGILDQCLKMAFTIDNRTKEVMEYKFFKKSRDDRYNRTDENYPLAYGEIAPNSSQMVQFIRLPSFPMLALLKAKRFAEPVRTREICSIRDLGLRIEEPSFNFVFADYPANAESAACQKQDIAARTSKKRKEPDERADDSTESKKRKIDDEQSQEL